jgi:hypothetical protein
MNIVDVCNKLFANKKLSAKRKNWNDESVKIFKIGWASQYNRDDNEPKSTNPSDYFLQHIKNNRLLGQGYPALEDIMAEDWEIFND